MEIIAHSVLAATLNIAAVLQRTGATGCSVNGEERIVRGKKYWHAGKTCEDALTRNGKEYDCTWIDVLPCPQL